MPNWACTHYIASGEREDLERFAHTLNTMPDLLGDSPFGFGRYWMGNLVAALTGMTYEQVCAGSISCRGTFDPDFGAQACFFGPYVDQKSTFGVDADGRMRFSAVSAWDRASDVEDLILEHFPGITLAWSSTDEFGNFHLSHNPEGLEELDAYRLNGDIYTLGEFGDFLSDLKGLCPGLDIPPDADEEYIFSDAFVERLRLWREEDPEEREVFMDRYTEC